MQGKAAVFIDGGYLVKLCSHKIDFRKLVDSIIDGRELHRAYYYNCLPYMPPNPTKSDNERMSKAQKFYKNLNGIPRFCVRLGKLRLKGIDGATGKQIFEQKRVDIMLGLDVASVTQIQPRIIDTVVLLTGDGDMLPAVEAARNSNYIVVLAHGDKNTYDQELWDSADERIHLDISFFNGIRYAP